MVATATAEPKERKARTVKPKKFVLQRCTDLTKPELPGSWEKITELDETVNGRKHVRKEALAGCFRVISVTDEFTTEEEVKKSVKFT